MIDAPLWPLWTCATSGTQLRNGDSWSLPCSMAETPRHHSAMLHAELSYSSEQWTALGSAPSAASVALAAGSPPSLVLITNARADVMLSARLAAAPMKYPTVATVKMIT